jgi:hypothetical protein
MKSTTDKSLLPSFFDACLTGKFDVIKSYFANGERPNCSPKTFSPHKGWTPLMAAFHFGNLEIVQYLLDQGLDYLISTCEEEMMQILNSTSMPREAISTLVKRQLETVARILVWYRKSTCVVPAIWHWTAVKGYCYLTVQPETSAGLEFYKNYFHAGGVSMMMDGRTQTNCKKQTIYILRPEAISFAQSQQAVIYGYQQQGAEHSLSHKLNTLFHEFLGEDHFGILDKKLVFNCNESTAALFEPMLRLPIVTSLGESRFCMAMSDILEQPQEALQTTLDIIERRAMITSLYGLMREIFPTTELETVDGGLITFSCDRIPDLQQRLSKLMGRTAEGWRLNEFIKLTPEVTQPFILDLIRLSLEQGELLPPPLFLKLMSTNQFNLMRKALALKPKNSTLNYANYHPWVGEMGRMTLVEIAALKNLTECVDLLLAENDSMHASSRVPFATLMSLPTLCNVAGKNYVILMELCITKGALTLVPPPGTSPPATCFLASAIENNALDVGICLLEHGTTFDVPLLAGKYNRLTPLQLAKCLKRTNFVSAFLQTEKVWREHLLFMTAIIELMPRERKEWKVLNGCLHARFMLTEISPARHFLIPYLSCHSCITLGPNDNYIDCDCMDLRIFYESIPGKDTEEKALHFYTYLRLAQGLVQQIKDIAGESSIILQGDAIHLTLIPPMHQVLQPLLQIFGEKEHHSTWRLMLIRCIDMEFMDKAKLAYYNQRQLTQALKVASALGEVENQRQYGEETVTFTFASVANAAGFYAQCGQRGTLEHLTVTLDYAMIFSMPVWTMPPVRSASRSPRFGVVAQLRLMNPNKGRVGTLFQPRVLPTLIRPLHRVPPEPQFQYQLASLHGLVCWYERLDTFSAGEQAERYHAVMHLRLLHIYGLMQCYRLDAPRATQLFENLLSQRPKAESLLSEYRCFVGPRLMPLLQTYCEGKSTIEFSLEQSSLCLLQTPETELWLFIQNKLAVLHECWRQFNDINSSITDLPRFLMSALSTQDILYEKRAPSVLYQVQAMASCVIQLGALASEPELEACQTIPVEIKAFIHLCQGPRQLFQQELMHRNFSRHRPIHRVTLAELTAKASALFTAHCLHEENSDDLSPLRGAVGFN